MRNIPSHIIKKLTSLDASFSIETSTLLFKKEMDKKAFFVQTVVFFDKKTDNYYWYYFENEKSRDGSLSEEFCEYYKKFPDQEKLNDFIKKADILVPNLIENLDIKKIEFLNKEINKNLQNKNFKTNNNIKI